MEKLRPKKTVSVLRYHLLLKFKKEASSIDLNNFAYPPSTKILDTRGIKYQTIFVSKRINSYIINVESHIIEDNLGFCKELDQEPEDEKKQFMLKKFFALILLNDHSTSSKKLTEKYRMIFDYNKIFKILVPVLTLKNKPVFEKVEAIKIFILIKEAIVKETKEASFYFFTIILLNLYKEELSQNKLLSKEILKLITLQIRKNTKLLKRDFEKSSIIYKFIEKCIEIDNSENGLDFTKWPIKFLKLEIKRVEKKKGKNSDEKIPITLINTQNSVKINTIKKITKKVAQSKESIKSIKSKKLVLLKEKIFKKKTLKETIFNYINSIINIDGIDEAYFQVEKFIEDPSFLSAYNLEMNKLVESSLDLAEKNFSEQILNLITLTWRLLIKNKYEGSLDFNLLNRRNTPHTRKTISFIIEFVFEQSKEFYQKEIFGNLKLVYLDNQKDDLILKLIKKIAEKFTKKIRKLALENCTELIDEIYLIYDMVPKHKIEVLSYEMRNLFEEILIEIKDELVFYENEHFYFCLSFLKRKFFPTILKELIINEMVAYSEKFTKKNSDNKNIKIKQNNFIDMIKETKILSLLQHLFKENVIFEDDSLFIRILKKFDSTNFERFLLNILFVDQKNYNLIKEKFTKKLNQLYNLQGDQTLLDFVICCPIKAERGLEYMLDFTEYKIRIRKVFAKEFISGIKKENFSFKQKKMKLTKELEQILYNTELANLISDNKKNILEKRLKNSTNIELDSYIKEYENCEYLKKISFINITKLFKFLMNYCFSKPNLNIKKAMKNNLVSVDFKLKDLYEYNEKYKTNNQKLKINTKIEKQEITILNLEKSCESTFFLVKFIYNNINKKTFTYKLGKLIKNYCKTKEEIKNFIDSIYIDNHDISIIQEYNQSALEEEFKIGLDLLELMNKEKVTKTIVTVQFFINSIERAKQSGIVYLNNEFDSYEPQKNFLEIFLFRIIEIHDKSRTVMKFSQIFNDEELGVFFKDKNLLKGITVFLELPDILVYITKLSKVVAYVAREQKSEFKEMNENRDIALLDNCFELQYFNLLTNTIFSLEENNKFENLLEFLKKVEKTFHNQLLTACTLRITKIQSRQNQDYLQSWLHTIKEINSFSRLSIFNFNFTAEEENLDILLKIASNHQADETWLKSKEEFMFKTIHSMLSFILDQNQVLDIRSQIIKEKILEEILSRLQKISKETSRKWAGFNTQKNYEEIIIVEKNSKDNNMNQQRLPKRRGVGYGNGGKNSNWSSANFYQQKQKTKEKIIILIKTLISFLSCENWVPKSDLLDIICESCLLVLLENSLRCSNLLELAKEKDLFSFYLQLIKQIAMLEPLAPALMDIGPEYQPEQKDSILKLLGQLSTPAQLFIKISGENGKNNENSKDAYKLAEEIIQTHQLVQEKILSSKFYQEQQIEKAQDYKNLPINESYKLLLKEKIFGYTNMKNNKEIYSHHWKKNFSQNYTPLPSKMIRLAQEIADLSNSLPIDPTNAIFVRADQNRLDVMRALIFGAEGTPYAHGAFFYDIYFGDNYPQGPPKINLTTTGNGDVRFNPNLYHCGKVCLSLLGTWRGNASENWDPNISTLNQVLISIQAVVMSEEVYFNEPGYERESGTELGEMKNVAYSNIVKLCNIKFAMIENLKNPPKGFEDVIKLHYYLKKDFVLEDMKRWRKIAEKERASYTGLVSSHNSKYCSRYRISNKNFLDDFDKEIKNLEKALDNLGSLDIESLLRVKIGKVKKKAKKETIELEEGLEDLDQIDVAWEENLPHKIKEINIEDAGVKDRWSRYIGVMGMEAVKKQASAQVLISGLNSLGIEIAKNIVLSGIKRLSLHDNVSTEWEDLAGQFFLGEEDIGKNRAERSRSKLQQLNYYVKVDTVGDGRALPKEENILKEFLKDYEFIVLIQKEENVINRISKICEEEQKKLIVCDCHGVFSRVFNYFGTSFTVFDKNGEEAQEVMIEKIEIEKFEEKNKKCKRAKIKLLEGVKHSFEDNETIVLDLVKGMTRKNIKKESINKKLFKIKIINYNSFYAYGDLKNWSNYIRGGTAKNIKIPLKINFKPFHKIYKTSNPNFEPNLLNHDFLKIGHAQVIHLCYLTLFEFQKLHKKLPERYNLLQTKEFYKLFTKIAKRPELSNLIDLNSQKDLMQKLVPRFCMTLSGNFAPQASFLGGIVSQEIIKGITGKFMPINQTMYFDCIEVLENKLFPKNLLQLSSQNYIELLRTLNLEKRQKNRLEGIRLLIGNSLLNKICSTQLFMVGSGAIGCELLKNYAMIGLGTGEKNSENPQGGKIVLTDPDIIEVSNLNRQFLFREKNLRKPKSTTAAAAAQLMNPSLKGHLIARLDRVSPNTDNIYSDHFFENMTIVTNALDNVKARRYIDIRCKAARTPLVESGTLGPKGHVQVIIPGKTETYGDMADPEEGNEIPHCTLKMFPEETLHCVEWARDLFGSFFTKGPKSLKKCLENFEKGEKFSYSEISALKDAIEIGKNRPFEFEDCIEIARKKFEKLFCDDIKQLIYVYPLDFCDKEGNPFWRLPKRPPHALKFNPEDELHTKFLVAVACMNANIFGIPLPKNIRKKELQREVMYNASKLKIADFVPSDEIAKEIKKDTEKNKKKGEKIEEQEKELDEDLENLEDLEYLVHNLRKISKNTKSQRVNCEEFEKDNDTNFHIDVIYSLANLRARNYNLEYMDWITVKIKAGRIVPALASTTASIAALQTLELIKVLKGEKVEKIKNAFLNLAVPILTQSEPGPAIKKKIKEGLEVSVWDRWEFKNCGKKTLKELFKEIERVYKVFPRDVLRGASPIYLETMGGENLQRKFLGELLDKEEGEYDDITITCRVNKADKEICEFIPPIRLHF